MGLKLNAPREAYQEFYGSNLAQMPKLVADGRVPMNVSQLMQQRLNFRNGPQDVKTAWIDNYFDSGDAVVYHPNGDVKVVFDSQTLREMNPQSALANGALVLNEDVYKALQGEVFKKGKLGEVNTDLTRAEAKAHPVWQLLARDKALLADYVDFIFARAKERFNYDVNMGVYPALCGGDAPEMRAFYVNRLDDRSRFDGGDYVYGGDGRLVGVAPEALGGASAKGASAVQRYTMADLQAYDASLKGLEAVVRPELITGVKAIRAKL